MAKSKPQIPPPQINPHLARIAAYPPGKPIEEVQREYGLKSVIKLASNENPLGPSPRALKAIRAVAGEMNRYPDGAGYKLKQAIAASIGVSPGEIMLGAGSDEIIALLTLAYLGPARGMVTSEYAFVRYKMGAEMAGAPCALAPMKKLTHDSSALLAAVNFKPAKRGQATVGEAQPSQFPYCSMLCMDVPGNPTGTMMTKANLLRVLRGVPLTTLVLLDQAYYEYACGAPGFPDGLKLRREFPNLVIARTFSKAYGLAGLRVGYAVARPEIVADFERVRPPFNVSRMAQAAATAALGDAAWVRRVVSTNAREMAKLVEGLLKLGCRPVPSRANFVLVDLRRDGKPVFQALLERGVVTRPMPGIAGGTFIRISVGTPEENRRCLRELKAVLK